MASAPRARSIFYAVHLFLEQIFSMSAHLEFWVTGFLHILCPPDSTESESVKSETRGRSMSDGNQRLYPIKFSKTIMKARDASVEGITRIHQFRDEKEYRILKILLQKMEEFLDKPNNHQCIKLDEISDHLKPYFLDHSGLEVDEKDRPRYVVSFKRIMAMFQNLRSIHFLNSYLFDNDALDKLVDYLRENANTTLRTVKFLYYQYEGNDKPDDGKIFMDPANLDVTELEALKWKLKPKKIEGIGYEIRLYRVGREE